MADKTAEENKEITVIGMIVMTEEGIGLEKGHFPDIMAVIELGVQAIVDQSGSRASTNRDRISYKCREYDNFVRDCPTSREEREIEQLQKMHSLEETKPLYYQICKTVPQNVQEQVL